MPSVEPQDLQTARRTRQGRRNERWGRAAETAISDWYAARGGEVLARRVVTGAGEIDLVIRFRDIVVFVEVKARRSVEAALSALSATGLKRFAAAAEAYAAQAGFGGDLRLDVAALDRQGRFEIVENASMGVV